MFINIPGSSVIVTDLPPVTVVSIPLPPDASTESKQDDQINLLTLISTKLNPPVAISAALLPLPVGAAVESKQDVGLALLTTINTKISSPMPVTVASLPLPTGASTEAKQDSQIAVLNAINTKITNPLPVSAASLPLPTGAATEVKQDSQVSLLTTINSKLNTLGQKTSLGSVPVVVASDQSNISVKFGDTPNIDAFGRLRVSDPVSIFECTFQYDAQPLLWSSLLSGTGAITYNANKASVDFTVGTLSGASAVYQTRQYFRYHAGKSQFIAITGNLGGTQANCRKRIGQFDAANGLFFELDGLTMNVVVRSSTSGSVVDTKVPQASWNLDPLNGTGPSGITLDPTKQQILFVDYQWLGSGRVRFGTIIGGQLIYAHQFLFANVGVLPYSQTATLPIRAELTNTGATASPTTTHLTCTTIYSEGGFSPEGVIRTASGGTTYKNIGAAGKIPIISLRKSTAGLHVPIRIESIDAIVGTADELLITFTINPTLTGAAFAVQPGFAETDVTATAMSGGTDVYSFYLKGTGNGTSNIITEEFFQAANVVLGSSLASVSDMITVSATSLSGAAQAICSMNYREIY